MVMLGFYGIDLFSRQQFLTADKKSKVQNEAMFVLSHMSKPLLKAIGDFDNPAVSITSSGVNNAQIVATIDSNLDGVRNLTTDANITYCFNNTACNAAAKAYTMVFVPGNGSPDEIIARHVLSFNAVLNGNFMNLTIVTCWQPSGTPLACGTLDNPAVNLTNKIRMPSVSAQ